MLLDLSPIGHEILLVFSVKTSDVLTLFSYEAQIPVNDTKLEDIAADDPILF